jgi:hypothetical protein
MLVTKGVLTHPDQVTAEWLTRVLTRSGALADGEVAALAMEAQERNLSTSAQLRPGYSAESRGDRPDHLFLKMVNMDQQEATLSPAEVEYYTRNYVDLAGAPLVRCYDAAYSATQRRYHLLLDDLSISHVAAWDKTPTLEYGLALAEALASLHAHRWGVERIAAAGHAIPGTAEIERFVALGRPGVAPIIDAFADQLLPHWLGALDELYVRHPRAMVARTRDETGFTLIHGDLNGGNVLVPRHADRPLYLLDPQPFDWSLPAWLGVYDLVNAIVPMWDVEVRRRTEMPMLRRYHEQLAAHGAGDYSWERLLEDYRLSVAMGVYVATEWCRDGVDWEWQHVWLPMLQRSLTACDDLNSRELWANY